METHDWLVEISHLAALGPDAHAIDCQSRGWHPSQLGQMSESNDSMAALSAESSGAQSQWTESCTQQQSLGLQIWGTALLSCNHFSAKSVGHFL